MNDLHPSTPAQGGLAAILLSDGIADRQLLAAARDHGERQARRLGADVVLMRRAADVDSTALAGLGNADRLLLMPLDELVLDEGALQTLVAGDEGVLCLPKDFTGAEHYELVDAETRATGVLLAGVPAVRQLLSTLGEWDFNSTLLRTLVQRQAARIYIEPRAIEPATLARLKEQAGRAVALQPIATDGPGEAWLGAPAGRWVARIASAFSLDAAWLNAATLVLGGGGVVAAAAAWPVTGLLLAIAALIVAFGADALAGATDRRTFDMPAIGRGVSDLAFVAAGLALANVSGQWGLALLPILALFLRMLERRVARVAGNNAWHSDSMTDALLSLAGVAAGAPEAGFGAAATAAAVALFATVRRLTP